MIFFNHFSILFGYHINTHGHKHLYEIKNNVILNLQCSQVHNFSCVQVKILSPSIVFPLKMVLLLYAPYYNYPDPSPNPILRLIKVKITKLQKIGP